MSAREAARTEARARGRTPPDPIPGPRVDGMGAASKITRVREDSRRRLADTTRKDADGAGGSGGARGRRRTPTRSRRADRPTPACPIVYRPEGRPLGN